MPQITIDVLAIRRNELVEIKIEYQKQRISRVVQLEEVNTPQKAVQWALEQKFPVDEIVTEIEKQITATIHQEIDPETGQPYWVIDSIDDVSPLPRDSFDDWVNTNVVDLDSAKEALKRLAGFVRKIR